MQRIDRKIEELTQRLASEWVAYPAWCAEKAIKARRKFWIKHYNLSGRYEPHQGKKETDRRKLAQG